MSHLSTIINRVKHRLTLHGNNIVKAAKEDSLFQQAVRNLREYREAWEDYTLEEDREATELYARYAHYVKDN